MRGRFSVLVLLAPVFILLMTLHGAASGGDPIAIVVLPPVQPTAQQESVAAAELFCDQLTAELAKDAALRVVDRTQIDRILAEKATDAIDKPALAYDALVRVNIDSLRGKPVVILQVIDLSAGNLVGSDEWPWTTVVPNDRLREMATTCKESAMKAVAVSKGQVKVRLLGVTTPGGMDRIQPMRRHFEEMIEQVVGRCSKVCVVQHLEALTAKEESLLLLLGHVQLAGGRQFAPHADFVLAAEVVELDRRDRTFDDTIIALRFRLDKNGQKGDWAGVHGKVSDWPKLAPQACQLLAEQLGQATPETAAEYSSEMITRRSQAEAELEVAKRHPDADGKPDVQRVAAAAKLDPTCEEAAYRLLMVGERWGQYKEEMIPEAMRFIERFPQGEHQSYVMHDVVRYYEHKQPKDLQQIETLRKIVELDIAGDIRRHCGACGALIEKVYRGWLANGVDEAVCKRWLEQVRRRLDSLHEQTAGGYADYRLAVEQSILSIQRFPVALAVESGDKAQARQCLQEFMSHGRMVARSGEYDAKVFRETVVKMEDKEMLAEYDCWLQKRTVPVEYLKLTWDDYPVYDEVRLARNVRQFSPMLPLAASEKAIYGVVGSFGVFRDGIGVAATKQHGRQLASQSLLCVPIDAEGDPTDSDLPLPQPNLNDNLVVTGAVFHAGTLYISTGLTGLLAYKEATREWKQITPEQGLPEWYIAYIQSLDKDRLLLVAGSPGSGRLSYSTFDVKTNQAKVFGHMGGTFSGDFSPCDIWWRDDKLMMVNRQGLVYDLFDKADWDYNWPDAEPYGWEHPFNGYNENTSMAVVGSRRYVMSRLGLHEMDNKGNVVRNWWHRGTVWPTSRQPLARQEDGICKPGDFPTDGHHPKNDGGIVRNHVTQSKDHLFVVGQLDGILCYEPDSDTWYGPLRPAANFEIEWPLGTAEGLWVGAKQGTAYIRTADFLDAAKAAGRVMTSADVYRRKYELAEKAGPLAAAQLHLSVRNFDLARERLDAFLALNPDDSQALLLMATLYEPWCLNRPDEAILWYRRLASLDQNRSAVYTGLFGEFRVHFALKRWEQVATTGERLLGEVPCLGGQSPGSGSMTLYIEQLLDEARQKDAKQPTTESDKEASGGVDRLRDSCRQQLAEKGAKQPEVEASNKEERPTE